MTTAAAATQAHSNNQFPGHENVKPSSATDDRGNGGSDNHNSSSSQIIITIMLSNLATPKLCKLQPKIIFVQSIFEIFFWQLRH